MSFSMQACHSGYDKDSSEHHHHQHHHHRHDRESATSPPTSPAVSLAGINAEFKELEIGSIKRDDDSDQSPREIEEESMSFHDKDDMNVIAAQLEQKLKQEFALISINNPIVTFEVVSDRL